MNWNEIMEELMEEMMYSSNYQKRKLLHKNETKGYKYYIMNLGTHLTAYINIPKGNKLYKKDYFDVIDEYEIEVHGDFTYSNNYLFIKEDKKIDGWFLGWDYNHSGDFNGFDIYSADKKWTTEEIDKECRYVIDQIIKINKEEVGIMEELDEIVERFEKAVEDLKLSQKKTATKVEKKEHKRWRAEEHGGYYYLLDAGEGFEDGIGIAKSFDYRNDTDVSRYELGNYFKTEEEAEQRLEHIKIEQQLKDIALRLNKGVEIDWEDTEQIKYHLYSIRDYIDYTPSVFKIQGTIFCLDVNFKDIAIEEIGEERLINYLKES